MERIASFTVDHTVLVPGLYLSRRDGTTVTFDLRFKKPNTGDLLSNAELHSVEHVIATLLRNRDEEEVLCKMIIVEGIMSIQAGENPKFLRDRLLTYMAQKQREGTGKGKGADKGGEEE